MLQRILLALLLLMPLHVHATDEIAVQTIALSSPLNQAKAEISGLSWCGDKLIFLPQYPERLSEDGNSYLYYLERQEILDYVDRVVSKPLQAKPLPIKQNELRKALPFFDGFEAIACKEDKLWLSIESLNAEGTYQSFVVTGVISFAQPAVIEVALQDLVQLDTQSKLENMGDEAIVMLGDDVIAIHEINDPRAVPWPKARRVSRQTKAVSELSFPHIPFRITDATELDSDNRFWVMNYKYSGDKFSRDARDLLSEKYGKGDSHKTYYNVERLVELEINDDQIKLVDSAPISLKMIDVEGRNWEGLVRLENRGFLLVTDEHPATIFGFVPFTRQP